MKITRNAIEELRGALRLATDATHGVAGVVERMHGTIQRLPVPVGRPPADRARGITGFVYRRVRGGIRLTGGAVELLLGQLEKRLPAGESPLARRRALAVLNGIHGDHLERTGNPLALTMTLSGPVALAEPGPSAGETVDRTDAVPGRRVAVLIHGLCMDEQSWQRNGFDYGARLAQAHGYTPRYLRYNTGLPIAENGRRLAELLEATLAAPGGQMSELLLLGHSMGGLLARSAAHHGEQVGHRWRERLRHLVCLGSPHHGAVLERAGRRADQLLEISPYSAPLGAIGKARSAGIIDLRHGSVVAEGDGFAALPEYVTCHAIAAVLRPGGGVLAERVVGDGLVSVASALGRHRAPERSLAFDPAGQWVCEGIGHLDLLGHQGVQDRLDHWLAQP